MIDDTDFDTAPAPLAERGLIAAVIRIAVMDAVGKDPKLAREAREWIASDAVTPWSAQWCADAIDLDLGHVQQAIMRRPAELRYRHPRIHKQPTQ